MAANNKDFPCAIIYKIDEGGNSAATLPLPVLR